TWPVTPHMSLALNNMAICYATGLDALGVGDLTAGSDQLAECFTADAQFALEAPADYAALEFTASSPVEFAQIVAGNFEALGLIRTQHQSGNAVIDRTGKHTAVMTSYVTAVHVFADESVLNITARYVDDVVRIGGKWMIAKRDIAATSLTLWDAFPPLL
ncbi:MAG: nuclear transport factor 2 family protein, partial [Myxococcota bacterium]